MAKSNHYSSFLARIYDSVLYIPIKNIRQRVSEELRDREYKKIIDLCCGTGNQLKYLQDKGFDNLKGVDLSDNMLRQAYRNGLNGVCQKMDASNTDFADHEFDAAIMSFALHETHAETARNIFIESKRIVRPDGKIIIVDYAFDKHTHPLGKFATRAVEKFVGGDHYRNFKFFIKTSLLKEMTRGIPLIHEVSFLMGAVRMWVYQNKQIRD
ncbi:MAG: class I SAM-dependent methyltransferase [Bacteroidota bacterium]